MTHSKTIKESNDFHMSTYNRFPVTLVSGKGSTLEDENGKQYIDFGSGIGVNSLGTANDQWVKAVSQQAGKIAHTSNLYYNDVQAKLSKKLCKATNMSKVFFANSGAEANECAIKVARKYSFDKYGKNRGTILTLKDSFHGRTLTTLAATGQDVFHNYFFPFPEGFLYTKPNSIDDLISITSSDIGNEICAIMLECIQGEGGVNPLDTDYLQQVQQLCKKKDILLIVDEIQTGAGRTGNFLASEGFGIKPDIVTMAKGLGGGLPIGACLCNEKLSQVMGFGSHGSTFGGNPMVCAGATVVVDKISNKEFLDTVKEKGKNLKSEIEGLSEVEDVRGKGLMLGVVLKSKDCKQVATQCLDSGLLVLTAKTLIRLLPPLNISKQELDKGISILKQVLNHT